MTPTSPVSGGTSTVSTGKSVNGQLNMTVSPASGGAGDMIAIKFSGLTNTAKPAIGMGLIDPTTNDWVKDSSGNYAVIQQTANASNSAELDFQVPTGIAVSSYSCVLEELDVTDPNNPTVVDYAVAPFGVTATSNGSTVNTGAPGSTVNGSSKTGLLKLAVFPGAGVAGDTITVTFTNFGQAYGEYVQLIDTSNNLIQVAQSQNMQTSTATSVEIDFTIPQGLTPGQFIVDGQSYDQNFQTLDDAQSPFTVNASSTPANPTPSANSVAGTSINNTSLAFTMSPGTGAPGATIACTLTGANSSSDQVFFYGVFDAQQNPVAVTATPNANNPSEVDFTIPAGTANGSYTVWFEETDQAGNDVDDASATLTVTGSVGSGATNPSNPAPANPAPAASSVQGLSYKNLALAFTCSPAGGKPGDTLQILVTAVNNQGDVFAAGLYDSNQKYVSSAQFSLNSANSAEIDLTLPSVGDGTYYVVVEEQDQNGNDIDDAVAQITIAGSGVIGSTTTTTTSTAGSTLLGSTAISLNTASAHVGDTVAVTITGLTSGNLAMGLVDANNPSAAPIAITNWTVNQANSTATSYEIDIQVPAAAAGSYQVLVEDFGPNATATSAPTGAAEAPLSIN